MDLTDKQVRVVSTAISSYPPKSVIACDVYQDISQGVAKLVATYELVFEELYSGPNDPALLSAISEKLSSLS